MDVKDGYKSPIATKTKVMSPHTPYQPRYRKRKVGPIQSSKNLQSLFSCENVKRVRSERSLRTKPQALFPSFGDDMQSPHVPIPSVIDTVSLSYVLTTSKMQNLVLSPSQSNSRDEFTVVIAPQMSNQSVSDEIILSPPSPSSSSLFENEENSFFGIFPKKKQQFPPPSKTLRFKTLFDLVQETRTDPLAEKVEELSSALQRQKNTGVVL